MAGMNSLKAKVQNGRLILDEPTDLPDGSVVELVQADPYAHLDDADDLDDKERAKLHAALEHSWAQAQEGKKGRPLDEILEDL